jgi:phosphomevalonate kinase
MSKNLDYLAKHLRDLILEIDTLNYVFNEICEKYLDRYAEDEEVDHPIRKLSVSLNVITNTNNKLVETLLLENILDPYFRKSLQMLAMMDVLKDGDNEFVKFVNKHIKD